MIVSSPQRTFDCVAASNFKRVSQACFKRFGVANVETTRSILSLPLGQELGWVLGRNESLDG